MSVSPSYEYDHGRVTLTFPASPEPFGTSTAAERYLKDRGFSVGRRQGLDPRGIIFGDVDIRKWRNLDASDRQALHGFMVGDGRVSPVKVTIFPEAPIEVRRAVVAVPTKDAPSFPGVSTRTLGVIGDIFAVLTIGFCVGAVGWVSTHPIGMTPGKIELRADALPALEARR